MNVAIRVVVVSLVVLAALSVSGSVSAETQQSCTLDMSTLAPLVDAYNANLDQAPGMVKGQLSGQRIDVHVQTASGERRFAVVTDSNARITQFDQGPVSDPSLAVTVDEQSVCDVLAAEDPATAFVQAYDRGDIDVQGVGVVNSVKIGVVKAGISIARFFGLF